MKILVHDYSGHPFQVQLSRTLARRGHDVLHLHCSSYVTGKGALAPAPHDPATFAVEAVDLGETFNKYAPLKRLAQEWRYGELCASRIAEFGPDVVLSSNTPLFAGWRLMRRLRRLRLPFVFWQQDIYSVAMAGVAARKLPVIGKLLGKVFIEIERRMLRASDHVVVISEDFLPVLRRWGIDDAGVTVVENWAPLDELDLLEPPTAWAVEHQLDDKVVALYSGTLGLKHNPGMLLELARNTAGRDDVRVVVISEGAGADWLRAQAADQVVASLVVLPFQDYAALPQVLASASVLLAILEPDAGVFSVPSKVLTYHCAGRPIVGAIPAENLAARIIEGAGSGLVTEPGNPASFVDAACRLLDDAGLREQLGKQARQYAETTFDVDVIAERFEQILVAARSALTTPP